MKAVDTNILVRLVVDDNNAQYALARKTVEETVFVPLTVLLELGWVMQSRYRMERDVLASKLRKLLDNPFIRFSDRTSVQTAIEMFSSGADFADAVHLVAARGSKAFVTFDRGVPDGSALGVPVEYL